MKYIEICNECGRSVNFGSNLFINRIPDFDDYKTRKENGKPFPKGDYICRECEAKLNYSSH
jgi:hypothetical protein